MDSRKSLKEVLDTLPKAIQALQDVRVPSDSLAEMESCVSLQCLLAIIESMRTDLDAHLPKLLGFLIERREAIRHSYLFSVNFEHSKINDACHLVAVQLASMLPQPLPPILVEYTQYTFTDYKQSKQRQEENEKIFKFMAASLFERNYASGLMSLVAQKDWKFLLGGVAWHIKKPADFYRFMVRQVIRKDWQALLDAAPKMDLFRMLWPQRIINFCSQNKDEQDVEQFRKGFYAVVEEQFGQMVEQRKQLELLRMSLQPDEVRAMIYVYAYLYEVNREKQHNYKSTSARVVAYVPFFNQLAYSRADKIMASQLFRDFVRDSVDCKDVAAYFKENINLLGALQEQGSVMSALLSLFKQGMQRAELNYPAAIPQRLVG